MLADLPEMLMRIDHLSATLSRVRAKIAMIKKHTSGTMTARWIVVRSDTNPITAVSTAPPMIAMMTSDDPALARGPRFLTLSAKMVGNISDIKKLVAASA